MYSILNKNKTFHSFVTTESLFNRCIATANVGPSCGINRDEWHLISV